MTEDPILSAELREDIIFGFEQRLRAQGNPMLGSVAAHELMLDQARSILDDVIDSYRTASENLDLGARPRRAGFMLKTIRASHRAELARLARDLHDRTAHTIGVAIQNLELHDVHAGRDAAQAREKLDRAREAMGQALDSVRHFFGELRRTVQPGELGQALTEYLAANAESTVATNLKVAGDTAMLPRDVCEEVYLTLREAIRNALVHSGTTRLDVMLGVGESQLHARVSDTGRGFSVEQATKAGEGIGLSSMRERVQLLGGTLRLSSVLGRGSTVDVSIPLGTLPP